MADLLSQAQRGKAIIISLNTRQDLEIIKPTHHYSLDETVVSLQPYLRLIFKLKPHGQQEVQDFLSNFFDEVINKQANRGQLLSKSQILEAVRQSTMSKLSIEQIADYLSGLPTMIDLEQESGEFLSIFKVYKVVRSLADVFGEIFIDW